MNKHKLKLINKRVKAYPEDKRLLWFYRLKIAKVNTSNEYDADWVSMKFNRWNPLTFVYLFCRLVCEILVGIGKGYKSYAQWMSKQEGTSYYVG